MNDWYDSNRPGQDSDPENSSSFSNQEENGFSQAEDSESQQQSFGNAADEQSTAGGQSTAGQQNTADSTDKKDEAVTYSWVSPKLNHSQDSGSRREEASDNANTWRSSDFGTAKTDTGSYSGAGRNENANSNTYSYSSNSSDSYSSDPFSGDDSSKKKSRKNKRQKKQSSGNGSKWAATVAMAVVFGLVGGLVFTGVSVAGTKLTGSSSSSNETVQIGTTGTTESTDAAAAEDSTETETTTASTGSSGGTVADVAAQAMPSLVTISTISVEEMQSFFGQTQQYEVEGAGTGVIVGQNDTELLIATNNHVISGATSLSVGFVDETAVSGAIKGYDADTDLAVVAVNLEDIPEDTLSQIKICEMGDSDALVLGEQVVAIGNALGYGQSVTSGYVSAFDRELTLSDGDYTFTSSGLIQTDASINSGNSGGALLNMKGQLIGINEAKSSGSSSTASVDNVGFAIPIAKAEPILEELMTQTTRTAVSEEDAAYIGITCADVNEETAEMYNMPVGVCLTSIIEGSPAEEAGLKKGDILTSFDGKSVTTYTGLLEILQYYAAGETVDVVIQRSDEGEYTEQTISLTLGSADDMPESYQSSGSDSSQQDSQDSQSGQGRSGIQQ